MPLKPSAHRNDFVPLKYARSMLRVAEAQGYDPSTLLSSLNLPQNPLDPLADPESLLDARYYTLIYSRVMWLLQDESFGLNLQRPTPTGTFRMMCMCIIHCTTLESALKRAAEFMSFCRNITGLSPVSPRPIKRTGSGRATYTFSTTYLLEDTPCQDNDTVVHAMAIWRRFCSWLIGRHIQMFEVRLKGPEPADSSYFEQILGCDIYYDQLENAFVMPEHYLDCPLVHTEDSLREFLRNAPYYLMVSTDDEDTSLLAQMKRIVGNDLSRDFPSVVTMAEQLNMSVRTLRRRLKDYDTTYQEFKDNLRKEHAIRWLNQPELKINAVSALLGFDEPSAFHRSFKKWTGMTPGEYRVSRKKQTSRKED